MNINGYVQFLSVGAVEYMDCISVEEEDSPKGYPGYDTK